jgi:hypothetical protein
MKSTLYVAAMLLISVAGYSQDEKPGQDTLMITEEKAQDTKVKRIKYRENQTIFGNRNYRRGGYGAFTTQLGRVGDEDAIFMGGRGVWVMGGGFGMGLGAQVLVNEILYSDIIPSEDLQLEMVYGGLYLEPIIASWLPVHVSFPILLGVGGAIYTDNSFRHTSDFDWDRDVVDDDLFFVFEPGASVELNIVQFFRIGLGAQYRVLGDLNLMDTEKDGLNGWSGVLTLKFGRY